MKDTIQELQLDKILFLDIETVPQYLDFESIPEESPFRALWEKKADQIAKSEEDTAASLYQRAGIYAEFGKIVCISVGYINPQENEFRVKSFYGKNEYQLLTEFAEMLNRYYHFPTQVLCAHNGKEFDFPYISRRMLIHAIPLPKILQMAGKKPWEVPHLDTMELWKFGDFKSYTSLELLSACFGLPTPKDDIKGSDVYRVYYEEDNLERIVEYCQKDTFAVAQLLLRIIGKESMPPDAIKIM
jgi:uncharacterized protein YprB with RNaseH-like and TPR domain